MSIDDRFRDIMLANTGCAVVMAGSDTDKDHIKRITDALETYEIPYEVRIISAHKQTEKALAAIREYDAVGGLYAIVTVAGRADALSGTASWHAMAPVIACPPDHPNESSWDNPPGSSNAYIAEPANVARFIAQMYAHANPRFRELIQQKNDEKIAKLDAADELFRRDWSRYSYGGDQ